MAGKRRKKKNQLLTRILVVSIAAHAIALPIAAHFGVFKNVQKSLGASRIIMFNTPALEQKEQAKEKPKEKPKPPATKTKANAAKAASRAGANNLPQPKVVTSGPANGNGGGGGPAAESGSGAAGQVPGGSPPGTKPQDTSTPNKPSEPVTDPKLKTESPKADPPRAEVPKVDLPRVKKILEAEAIEAPEPKIPDRLRTDPLDKTLVVEADIDTGGHPTNVKIVSSTGIEELDKIGLDTATRYRFRPATIDGTKVEQHVRFRIEFKVE